ncbi:serine/threonine-protein kinase 17B isoform X2 [Protopterus annectens]|uniref:serine/threonine-protein kinase 17B isoform X2 n=1 Tax=Protopterus annectens TaxID=7888 RepID=UPI001CFA8A1B|nr:serine/threonine-protein kinase 17B isoform X2 [Protopterus annectens]
MGRHYEKAFCYRGKFAVVKKCIEKSTGNEYAAKFLKKRRRGQDCRAEIIHEIGVLDLAKSNSRVIDLHEVYESTNEIILVLEYAAGGELFNKCVDRDDSFTENDVCRFLRQILEGVLFLHRNGIVHLDLKPQNILLTDLTPDAEIKIVDFGLSRRVVDGSELREIMGTPEYVAPEILNYEPISTATDMWSIGVMAYMMLTGESPFLGEDKQETYLNVSQVNVDYSEETFTGLSQLSINFLKTVLVKNPEERATAEACLFHPWLQEGDFMMTPCTDKSAHIFQFGEQINTAEERIVPRSFSHGLSYRENRESYLDDSGIEAKRFRFDDSFQHPEVIGDLVY